MYSLVADFDLTQPSNVEISVFNAQGMLLKKISGNYDAGKIHQVINANLSSGIYLVKMNFDGQVVTKETDEINHSYLLDFKAVYLTIV